MVSKRGFADRVQKLSTLNEAIVAPTTTTAPLTQPTSAPSPAPMLIPVDCVLGDWNTWSACADAGSSGTQARFRLVKVWPDAGGAACDEQQEARPCRAASVPAQVAPTIASASPTTLITLAPSSASAPSTDPSWAKTTGEESRCVRLNVTLVKGGDGGSENAVIGALGQCLSEHTRNYTLQLTTAEVPAVISSKTFNRQSIYSQQTRLFCL